MSDRPRILFIDSNASDIELASLLLQQTFPGVEITSVSDAPTLFDALRRAAPEVVITTPAPLWTSLDKLLELIRGTWQRSAVVVFGAEQEILRHGLAPAAALHGIATKSSAGFIALPKVVHDILQQRAQPPPTAELDGWPLPAARIDAAGCISAANTAFATACDTAIEQLVGVPLAGRLADGETAAWTVFLTGRAAAIELRLAGVDGVLHVGRDAAGHFSACLISGTGAPDVPAADSVGDTIPHEFGDMALVFSHDLKEPIQQVVRLVQRLEDSHDEQPRNEDKLMRQLRDCATRTANMLDSMVAYLTVSASQAEHALVDLDGCLEEALDNLRPAIEESAARITTQALPGVIGNAVQMVHLFQNLIANAIKFHGPATPEIQITAECVDQRLRISFHDNGIGISATQRERVFEMGKRLHTQEEFPGTGMGLTLCRRIAERHGGSIRIEAGSQGGSVVVVELPLPPPATSHDSLDRARKPPP
ncbi:MAG: ATP-binding protein [Gammaproteobacteria bacterium]